jgi:glycosyltransferase involved in cell wall biosynthesis
LRQKASVGLQPYAKGAPQGLANKLFEYLSAGIPVLSSLAGENAALLETYECGITYRVGDAADFYDKLTKMLTDESVRRRMGNNGLALFKKQFDADRAFDNLVQYLENLVGHIAEGKNAVAR